MQRRLSRPQCRPFAILVQFPTTKVYSRTVKKQSEVCGLIVFSNLGKTQSEVCGPMAFLSFSKVGKKQSEVCGPIAFSRLGKKQSEVCGPSAFSGVGKKQSEVCGQLLFPAFSSLGKSNLEVCGIAFAGCPRSPTWLPQTFQDCSGSTVKISLEDLFTKRCGFLKYHPSLQE